ncbi:Crp/Fnr family transcriptional regulator [Tolypothrix sp. NIES-4075]|uniref:helix-turn-helix domain-containing protein n=1 Tax=Tolypothrix sp. NIES-4075 TaxID=2005459 RepID=UPI000B5C2375|nr:helix-turn-helix domain-containing protein [Tolypothrix sp. NIES-4075]GAX42475.1 Crp/Fnr family transcriptional regulator [Tolypothrix sp. NIES-4075]
MNVEQLATNAEVFHRRLAGLHETTKTLSWISPDLLPQAFKELIATSNTLQLAAEELYEQNEELVRTSYLLEEECQTYQDLFELTSDAYLVTNSEGIIVEANSAACDLLACSKRFLVGKPIFNFVSLEECQRFPSEIEISQSQKSRELVPLQRQSNSSYVALTVGVVKNKQGKPQTLHWLRREKTGHQRVELTPLNYDCNDYDISKKRPVHKYYKGETIPLNPLVICYVLQGSVKLSTFCETGQEVMLGLAAPDMVFGSSITSLNTYEAIALSDVELVTIYEAEIAANPFLSYTLLPKIKQRLCQTESFLFIFAKRRVEERLQDFLLLLKQEIGQTVAKGTRISIRLTHEEIASACCTTRVTITRLLGKLQRQGFISLDSNNHIIILGNG